MFWKYIFTYTNSKLNSTPLQNVPLHARQHGYHPVPINFFMIVNAKVLSKAGFAEIVSVIILNLNFFVKKNVENPFLFATRFHELDQPGTPAQELSRTPKNTFPVYTENELKLAIDKPF